jgi:hypothetical protein
MQDLIDASATSSLFAELDASATSALFAELDPAGAWDMG